MKKVDPGPANLLSRLADNRACFPSYLSRFAAGEAHLEESTFPSQTGDYKQHFTSE